jgi:YgiT-type zinc finger domain-containing protein
MNCPLCRGRMVKDKAHLPYQIGDDQLVVIKGVPATVCKQCGEVFIDIAVARVVERILSAAERDGVTLGFLEYREAA